MAIKCQHPQSLTRTHLSTPAPLRTQTHTCKTRKTKTVQTTCGSALSHRIKAALFVPNPLVAASTHAVTAHQSSVGGQSFDDLLRVTASAASDRPRGSGLASQPPQSLAVFPTTHCTRQTNARSRTRPGAALLLSHKIVKTFSCPSPSWLLSLFISIIF